MLESISAFRAKGLSPELQLENGPKIGSKLFLFTEHETKIDLSQLFELKVKLNRVSSLYELLLGKVD